MFTRQGIEYWMEDGQFTIDGYDFFDTLEAMESDIDHQLAWSDGRETKHNGIWTAC